MSEKRVSGGDEMAVLLSELGWTWAEFGRRARVHRNTVSRWRHAGPPEPVLWSLRKLVAMRRMIDAAD